MQSVNIINEYIDLIKSNEEKYYKDYLVVKEMVKNSNAYYRGEPIKFAYQPLFINRKDQETFQKISDMTFSIGSKVLNHYIENPEYRKLFGFPKFIEDMILVDPGYSDNFPMCRIDVFYQDEDNFALCEINTDGSSGMNSDNKLSEFLLRSQGLKDFSERYSLSYYELFDSWVDETLRIYKEFDPENPTPNVAIVDLEESITGPDFEEYKKAYERAGLNCRIVDVRNVKYRDGALYDGDYRIDLIYRRLVTFELINSWEDSQEFIKAYMDGAVCTVGSIRTQIIHNKMFFKVLFDKETHEFLSEEEVEFIKKHVPETGVLLDDDKLIDRLKSDKDKYIIKPMDNNSSTGVYAGREMSQEDWEKSLEKDRGTDTLYQVFVEPYIVDFVEFEDGKAVVNQFTNMCGIYNFSGKFMGLYNRMGRTDVIRDPDDYIVAPTIMAIRRDMDDILPRINELAKFAKERKLSLEETLEREELRTEYLHRFRAGMKNQLMNIKVVDEEGKDITEEKLGKLYKDQKKKR